MICEMVRIFEESADIVGRITSLSWQAAYKGIVPEGYLVNITPEFRSERYKLVLERMPDVEFYLVSVNNQPAGVVNLFASRDEDARCCGEIGLFYFLQEYWGGGYAAEAMRFALVRLGELGFQSVVLWALEENRRAIRFYEKQGFILDGGSKVVSLGRNLVDVRYRKVLK